jgi:hypothetical protein
VPDARVLLWQLPKMLTEIVSDSLRDQHDMVLVLASADTIELRQAVAATHADVAIVDQARWGDGAGYEVPLMAFPCLKIFAVSDAGKRTVLHELRPQRVPLGELSPSGLLTAIRNALREPCVPPDDARPGWA